MAGGVSRGEARNTGRHLRAFRLVRAGSQTGTPAFALG
jgi:hypothetical protein